MTAKNWVIEWVQGLHLYFVTHPLYILLSHIALILSPSWWHTSRSP